MAPDFENASAALWAAYSVRFLLEMALLVGIAVLAWNIAPTAWQWPFAIIAPILGMIFWGLFLSPKATIMLPEIARFIIEAGLFLGVGAGLWGIGYWLPAIIGVSLWSLDKLAIFWLER